MPQVSVYNEIPGKSDEKLLIAGHTKKQSNTSDGESTKIEVPASNNAGKSENVTHKGKKSKKEITFQNLEGDLEITPTPKNFRIVSGMTVRIVGIGKFLSGFYYVMSRYNSISNSGAMTIKLSVVKTKFGDSLKGEDPINITTEDLIGDKDSKTSNSGGNVSVPDYVDNTVVYPQSSSTPNTEPVSDDVTVEGR